MKILLGKCKASFFLAKGDEWTNRIEEAHNFPSGAFAIDYAVKHRLGNIEVVLVFEDRRLNLTIPL